MSQVCRDTHGNQSMQLKAMTLSFDRDLVDEKLVVIESHVTGLAGKDRTHKMTILKASSSGSLTADVPRTWSQRTQLAR